MVSSSKRASRTAEARSTRAKPAVSYAESSSDDDFESEDEDTRVERAVQHVASRIRIGTSTQKIHAKRKRPSTDPEHSESRASRRRKGSQSIVPKTTSSHKFAHNLPSGTIPPWQILPYHVLVQIFQYASYPLYDQNFQHLPSGKWLLNTARLCRAFAEPAFTVLYSSPPLVPMVMAHRLVDLLKADPLPMAYKYRQKVEALHVEIRQVAAYTLPGSGHLDLYGLIKDLPRLTDLEFYHSFDMPPYRDLDTSIRWIYPTAIIEALEYVDPAADPARGDKTSVTKLRSWRWSSRLAGLKYPVERIREIHLKPSFRSLRKVAFVNYQVPLLKKDEKDPKHEHVLARSLEALPELEHLIFEASTLCNAKLLPLLPKNLRNLEFITCWEINAAEFAAFLLTHGSQLRCLTLNHNQSLSLAFLPVLGTGCPKLQVLRMDLTYFSIHQTYKDSEPIYESLLLADQCPVWPATLQIIELTRLRKWENDAAEMFFQSLIDSSGNLPDLRRLVIQAILNIGWRDRASFRDKWIGSLNRVFKRVSKPPSRPTMSQLTTGNAVSTFTEEEAVNDEMATRQSKIRSSRSSNASKTSVSSSSTNTLDASPPSRRSARASTKNLQSGTYAESSDESEVGNDAEYQATTETARPEPRINKFDRELNILRQTAGVDSPSFSSGSEDDTPLMKNDKGKGRQRDVIQGMCEVVEVRIDNLRPTETQVTEADFLDEEKSGDEDWNGDDVDGPSSYAW